MKLKTLKPRIGTIQGRLQLASAIQTDRLRGRAAVTRRAHYLEMHPLCVRCEAQGRIAAATDLDHRVALVNGGADTEDNLQGLCAECHKAKTAEDMGHRQIQRIGVDGWPEA